MSEEAEGKIILNDEFKKKEGKMEELIEKIIKEIQDNLILPGYSDKELRDMTAFILTVAFSVIGEVSAGIVAKKKG